MTGIVTDDTGSPIADAGIAVDYSRGGEFSSPTAFCPPQVPDFCWIKTVTNGGGQYEVGFEAGVGLVHGGDGAGLIYSWHDGYEADIQMLPRGAGEIVKNLRLPRVRTISGGQSITVAIGPESSLCSDLEDLWLLTSRCENVQILTANPGTLTVEARASDARDTIPFVLFATTGRYTSPQVAGTGTASVGVQAGERYRILIGTPSGTTTGRFDVSTSLR